jgi:hypothetical protein
MRHAVVLGLALGALSTIKLTGPMFGLLPALAVVSRFRAALADWRHMLRFIGIALIVFVAVYLVLMGRFVYYYTLAEWLALYPAGMNAFTSWREILPWDFSLYYNDELVRGHGVEFIALYAVCTVALALVAIRERDSTAAFLVLSLIAYSLYSASTMKYARGGYHLIPLFLAVIAYTAAWLWRAQRFAPLRYAALAIIGLTMASSLSKSFAHYQARAENVQEVSATLGDLWRPAQQWLKANIAPSDRICIEIHSEWTLPLNDMAAQTTYGPFAYPYTESAALSRNEPPEDAVVKAACDFIVSGGAHRFLFDWRRRHGDVANAERWVAYFRALPERFPRVRFETKRKVWLTQWIEIYRIKGAPNTPR